MEVYRWSEDKKLPKITAIIIDYWCWGLHLNQTKSVLPMLI